MLAAHNHSDVPTIQRLHDYWQGLAGGAVPSRSQLDPAAIKPLLPFVCIVEFEDAPFRVRYRLSGSMVDEFNGFNITGTYLDQLLPNDPSGGAAHLLAYYRRCWESGRPCFSAYRWPTRSGSHLDVKFAMFPLLVDGAVRQAIAIEDWEHTLEPIAEEAVPFKGERNKTDD
ncbi:MAG: PAS domain-containing protein [Rhodospirillaceae bacterium]|nr:PAS domain-containing protein [Rhodospirillaceae bacterium]